MSCFAVLYADKIVASFKLCYILALVCFCDNECVRNFEYNFALCISHPFTIKFPTQKFDFVTSSACRY